MSIPRYKHPLYKTWVKMRERCLSEKSDAYRNYGGRGIKICDRWRDSFHDFTVDMGERPENTTLDRIDSDGDYIPENCRWASKKEQARGRRKTRWFVIDGEKMCLVDVAEKYNIKRETLHRRLKMGMSIELAVKYPVGSLKSNQCIGRAW